MSPAPITIISFGYLHGPPPEAEVVYDVRRHFRDPHVDPSMRELTAEHPAVRNAVMSTSGVTLLANSISRAILAYRCGSHGLAVTVAVGCAGGRHRSAVVADWVGVRLADAGYHVNVEHRDIALPVVTR
jgi:RNase adaptor protein for sRNA GlmZ degradation